MKIIELSGNKIELYDDIKELSIKRYRTFQKYLMIDIGIGSSMDDVMKHFEKLHFFLSSKKVDFAIKEAENLHFAFHELLGEIDYKCYCFCCLIHTINGEKIDNFSEEYLDSIVEKLDEFGFTQQMIEDYLDQIKKKLITN